MKQCPDVPFATEMTLNGAAGGYFQGLAEWGGTRGLCAGDWSLHLCSARACVERANDAVAMVIDSWSQLPRAVQNADQRRAAGLINARPATHSTAKSTGVSVAILSRARVLLSLPGVSKCIYEHPDRANAGPGARRAASHGRGRGRIGGAPLLLPGVRVLRLYMCDVQLPAAAAFSGTLGPLVTTYRQFTYMYNVPLLSRRAKAHADTILPHNTRRFRPRWADISRGPFNLHLHDLQCHMPGQNGQQWPSPPLSPVHATICFAEPRSPPEQGWTTPGNKPRLALPWPVRDMISPLSMRLIPCLETAEHLLIAETQGRSYLGMRGGS